MLTEGAYQYREQIEHAGFLAGEIVVQRLATADNRESSNIPLRSQQHKVSYALLLDILRSQGRPVLEKEIVFPSSSYSISHSDLWVSCLVLKIPQHNILGVGMDIQTDCRFPRPEVIKRITKRDSVKGLAPLILWTVKEALFKATRVRSQPPLSHYSIQDVQLSDNHWHGKAICETENEGILNYWFWGKKLSFEPKEETLYLSYACSLLVDFNKILAV